MSDFSKISPQFYAYVSVILFIIGICFCVISTYLYQGFKAAIAMGGLLFLFSGAVGLTISYLHGAAFSDKKGE